jgi:tetratricopeptide (TPR) repeat protein
MAGAEIARDAEDDLWCLLKIQAELTRGKYDDALVSLEDGLRRYPASLPLILLGRDVYRASGRLGDASAMMKIFERLVADDPRLYNTPHGRIVLGRYLLLRGADSRKVLDQLFDVALKERPDLIEGYYATAELALAKEDYALAAETLQKAPKEAGEDPQSHYLLARAYANDDRVRSTRELAEALKINPRHLDSLLLRVDEEIDAEAYAEASKDLQKISELNPAEPRAWAYRAVLAHLDGKPDEEAAARKSALSPWAENPEVDHLIGRKLAQKYRFAEGAAAQKRALLMDSDYLPAKVQLCQDLLRLGDEEEGWKLADEVFARDGYNIVAYNLVTLHGLLSGFRTLRQDGLLVRMEPREADLYGARVLDLLGRARKTLCEKYGIALAEPVIVEIFPRRNEFAVRTFGLPGADGLLGVCFGRVITANSPASQGETPSNWEAVLWHEFCHVVTLTKTRNKMPRWLSEGISVYEEGRQDPAWARSTTPQFRAMLLGPEFTPLSKLSSAFLGAKTPIHVQFAYHESAMAVDFLVGKFGLPALKGLLDDLASGTSIAQALPARTRMTLDEIDRQFALFARKQAEGIAPGATWEEPELPPEADSAAVVAWLEKHPRSFPGLRSLGARLVAERKWPRAKEVLEGLRKLYPDYVGPENPYVLLAAVYKHLNDPASERAVLEELAARDGDASPAYLRLMELAEAAEDWQSLARNALRLMAVNPLIPAPHRQLALAAEHLGDRDEAIRCSRALLLIDESDPAGAHYRLARLLRDDGDRKEARREVLKALDEAPRFIQAHELLLDLVEPPGTQPHATRSTTPEDPRR